MPWRVLVLVMVAGCIEADIVRCEDGSLCPADTVCAAALPGCVFPEQVEACVGHAELDGCVFAGTAGTCQGGVCTPLACGDGVISDTEDCEPGDLNGATCLDFDYYEPDGLQCTADCRYDWLTGCGRHCGDGVIDLDDGEDCDGAAVGAATCQTLDFYDPDGLACTSFCTFDVSACTGSCGDGVLNGPELCDGLPPGGSCLDVGFDAGRLECALCAPGLAGCSQLGWDPDSAFLGNQLNAVWAGTDERIAVGNGGVIARDTGAGWTVESSGVTTNLNAVTDGFAVGDGGVILHDGGAGWTAMTSGVSNGLRAVWAAADDDVFAVGDTGTILHYNGASWTSMTSGTTSALRAVHGTSGSDVYAVSPVGTILHYNGTSWSPMTGTGIGLNAVWALAPGSAVAAGNGIIRLGGGTWTAQPTNGGGNNINALWFGSATDGFAVGAGGNAIRYDGHTWFRVETGANDSLLGVSGLANGDVVAVTSAGDAVRFGGRGWDYDFPGNAAMFYGMHAYAPDDVIGVTQGSAWHYDGLSWTTFSNGPPSDCCFDAWGAANDLYAIGGYNVNAIYRYTGTWTQVLLLPIDQPFSGVWGSGPTDVYAVGAQIRHGSGTSWTSMALPSGSGYGLRDVWGSGPGDVYAVGSGGDILHLESGVWTKMTSGVTAVLTSVWGSSAGDVYVGGDSGLLLHREGATWRRLTTGVGWTINEITGTGPHDVWLVGNGSELLHYDGVAWSPVRTRADSYTAYSATVIGGDLFVGSGARLTRRCTTTEVACGDGWDDDCDGDVDCGDPDCDADAGCTAGGACEVAATLACGDTIDGSTRTGSARIDDLRCAPESTPGPEVGYRFTATQTGTVTVTLAGTTADLTVAVVGTHASGACDPEDCLAAGDATASFTAAAGETYMIVVDGPAGIADELTLSVACP